MLLKRRKADSRPEPKFFNADAKSESIRHIIVLTGMSGAGKSQALKSLEDMGYETIDNIPLNLLGMVAGQAGEGPARLVLGVDIRSRDFSSEALFSALENWRGGEGNKVTLAFLDCDDEALQRRFTETRHKHPLAMDRAVTDGIALERELLRPIKAQADTVIDTTAFTIHDLKRHIKGIFGSKEEESLLVFVTSFSYRDGVPRDADMVLDARFLKNPHYDEALRDLNGRDEAIARFIEQDKGFPGFFSRLCELVAPLLPRYKEEGKSYFTIAIGCTGGKHRSVFLAEKLAGFLSNLKYKVNIRHRDLK